MINVKNYDVSISPNDVFNIILKNLLYKGSPSMDAANRALELSQSIVEKLSHRVAAKVLSMVPAIGWSAFFVRYDGSTETLNLNSAMICALDDGSIRILMMDDGGEGFWKEVSDDPYFSRYLPPASAKL